MISVLIVNWNTRDLLDRCLVSLRTFPPPGEFEIIVVDNASSDGSAEMVRANHPQVTLVANTTNSGYADGNNDAFSIARGDFLLTLNPDTEIGPQTMREAVARLDTSPAYGALGARLRGVDGKTQPSVRGFPSFLGIVGDITGLANWMPHSKLGSYRLPAFNYDQEQQAPQPMGTFLLFRRSALEAVGDPKAPFDPQFPIFFNEVDLLYRMNRAGWPCLYAPSVEVLHHGGMSTRQVRKNMIWESHKGLVRFLWKHYRTPWNVPGLAMLSAVIYLGAFIRARGYHVGFRS